MIFAVPESSVIHVDDVSPNRNARTACGRAPEAAWPQPATLDLATIGSDGRVPYLGARAGRTSGRARP